MVHRCIYTYWQSHVYFTLTCQLSFTLTYSNSHTPKTHICPYPHVQNSYFEYKSFCQKLTIIAYYMDKLSQFMCTITAHDSIELIVEHDNVPFFSSHKTTIFVQYRTSYFASSDPNNVFLVSQTIYLKLVLHSYNKIRKHFALTNRQ